MKCFNKNELDKFLVYRIDKKFEKNVAINHVLDLNEKYPNDFVHCLISNHVFCSLENKPRGLYSNLDEFEDTDLDTDEFEVKFNIPFNIKDFINTTEKINKNINEDDFYHSKNIINELSNLNWIILSKYITCGYKCITYINENRKHIIVAYQGIKFKFADLFSRDYESYILSLNSLIRKHLKLLIKTVNQCVRLSNELNYSLSFTGYSFGAMYAQLSTFICHKYLEKTQVKAIVFESIGLYELLDKLNNETNIKNIIDLNDLDIRIYLSYPSFLNTINMHVGKIICPYDYCVAGKLKSCHLGECIIGESKIECSYSDDNIDPFYVCGLKSFISLQLKSFYNHFKTNSFYIVDKWPINYNISISTKTNFIKRSVSTKYQIDTIDKFIMNSLKLLFKKFEEIKSNKILDNNVSCNFLFQNYLDNDIKFEYLIRLGWTETHYREVKLLKEFIKRTDILVYNNINLDRKYDFSKPITILTGESGSGKSTFVANYSRELISRHEFVWFCWIDCSSFQNMKHDLSNFSSRVSLSVTFQRNFSLYKYTYEEYLNFHKIEEEYKDFYEQFHVLAQHIVQRKIKTLFIFDNLAVFYYLKILFKKLLFKRKYIKIIITTNNFDPTIYCKEFESKNYNIIEIDKLSKNECNSILKSSEIHLTHVLKNNYEFTNFIDDLFRNEDDNKISIGKVISLKNILKSTKYKPNTKQEILKYNEDLLDFIRKDNRSAFEFLSYIVYLDINNIKLNLLKHVYRLIYNYGIYFERDKSFETNFNQDIEYLVEISVLTKKIKDNYIIHDSIRSKFENFKILNFEKKIKITLTNLLALNNLYELNVRQDKMNNGDYFYDKHFNVILSGYWKNKLRSFKNLAFFKVYEHIVFSNGTYMLKYKNSLKITLDNIDKFINEYNQKKITQIKEKRKIMQDKILELENLLKDGLFYLDKEIKEIENKIQLKLEEDIAKIKNENEIDINIDENDLNSSQYSDLLTDINIKKDYAEINIETIKEYYKKCVDSFNKKDKERHILIEELKFRQYYEKYFDFVFKNVNFEQFFNQYSDYLNTKRVIKILELLKYELIKPVEKFVNDFLYDNCTISYFDSDLLIHKFEIINKKSSDSECSKISEERFNER